MYLAYHWFFLNLGNHQSNLDLGWFFHIKDLYTKWVGSSKPLIQPKLCMEIWDDGKNQDLGHNVEISNPGILGNGASVRLETWKDHPIYKYQQDVDRVLETLEHIETSDHLDLNKRKPIMTWDSFRRLSIRAQYRTDLPGYLLWKRWKIHWSKQLPEMFLSIAALALINLVTSRLVIEPYFRAVFLFHGICRTIVGMFEIDDPTKSQDRITI